MALEKLSRNFTVYEFTHAGSGKKIKNEEQHNLTFYQMRNAKNLAVHVLQPIRNYINLHYGYGQNLPEIPLIVISGFRCKFLNDKVKGAPHSYHMKAMAADIKVFLNGMLRTDLIIEAIKVLELPFTELIKEYGSEASPLWIHIALDENNICHAVKRANLVNGKKVLVHQAFL